MCYRLYSTNYIVNNIAKEVLKNHRTLSIDVVNQLALPYGKCAPELVV